MPRIYRQRPPLWFTILLVLIMLVSTRFIYWAATNQGTDSSHPALAEGEYALERVVDGDTLLVRLASETQDRTLYVRLLGIDAPETVKPDHPVEPWGVEASQFTQTFVGQGPVRLRFGRRRVDKYDRLLAYVFVEERLLNAELARAGLAQVQIYPGDQSTYSRQIEKAEAEARAARKGIWSTP